MHATESIPVALLSSLSGVLFPSALKRHSLTLRAEKPSQRSVAQLGSAALLRAVHIINHHGNWCSLEGCSHPHCLLHCTYISLP